MPSNTYPCRDGHYVIIAGNGDAIFKRFMRAIGRDDLAADPRLARNDGRVEHNAMLDAAIADWTGRHDLHAVLDTLEAASVPCGKIYTAADVAADPHYHARGMLETHTLPDGTPVDLPGIVPKLSATPGRTDTVGPTLGQHTDDILRGLGISDVQIAGLRAAEII